MKKLDVRYVMSLSGSTKLYNMMERVDSGTGTVMCLYTITNEKSKSAIITLVIPVIVLHQMLNLALRHTHFCLLMAHMFFKTRQAVRL